MSPSGLGMTGQGMTLSDLLGRQARGGRADAVALADRATRRTYRELDERVSRLAVGLAGLGIGRGERVAVLSRNRVEMLETYYACARLGAVCVPVNFRLVAEEIAYLLEDSGARLLLVDPEGEAAGRPAAGRVPVLVMGEEYEALLAGSTGPRPELDVPDTDAAFIMYTSGTTGRPKGAVLTHRNLYLHALSQIAHIGWAPDDRVYFSGSPLFHIAGLSGTIPQLILGGRNLLGASGGFDPAETLRLFETERVSSCFFVPAQWAALCAVPELASRDLAALRRITWGAAPASTTLLRTMLDAFPQARMISSFGQTECSPVTCVLLGEDALGKIGSVGTPMTNVEIRVVDDEMRDVPAGEVGEIVYRGPMVMREYWNRPEETAEAFRGGWFHSGDLVRRDADGYVFVVDRKKDMIISGGENIYCAEVENAVAAHPKVADVAVIGVPDERWGETPLALVVPRDPTDPPAPAEITEFTRGHLAGYKVPRLVQIVDELPRNAGGKILKHLLRKDFGAIGSPL